MSPSIEQLEQGTLAPGDVDALLAEQSFPVVDGNRVTFVYRGQADQVHLRHWIYGLSSALAFQRVPGTDLWYLNLDLPAESRVEYKLEVVRGRRHQLIQDPLNPHLAHDPYGANSVVHATGYSIPDWTLPDPEARPGSLEELTFLSEILHGPRPVQVYKPARFRETRRYPLLVVHDGSDFLRFSGAKTVLDNLIHRLEIPPMIVAMTDSPGRLTEYANDQAYADHVVSELVPALEERFPIVSDPGFRGILGASFGAVGALSAAWRHPGFFGKLFLLSGSFAFTDIGEHDKGPVFDPVVDFVNAFRKDPGRPADRLYMTCGMYEPMIYYNRSLLPVMQSTGMEVRYSEARDGHNWENWRDRLRAGLSWLFPGPLWLVYE